MVARSDFESAQNRDPRGIVGFVFSRRSLARCFQDRAIDRFMTNWTDFGRLVDRVGILSQRGLIAFDDLFKNPGGCHAGKIGAARSGRQR